MFKKDKEEQKHDVKTEHHTEKQSNKFKIVLEITAYIVTIVAGIYSILKDFI